MGTQPDLSSIKGRNKFIQLLSEIWYTFVYFFHLLAGIFFILKPHPSGTERPVVLVPGCSGRSLSWASMQKSLVKAGHPVYSIPLGFQLGNLEKKGKQLEQYIIENEIHDCYIIGHSMGGLIARSMAKETTIKIKKIITLGTPHRGTYLAWFAPIFIATLQLIPGSKFLKKLNNGSIDKDLIQSVYSAGDLVIIPNSSAVLEKNSGIPFPELGHNNLFMSPTSCQFILKLLELNEKN